MPRTREEKKEALKAWYRANNFGLSILLDELQFQQRLHKLPKIGEAVDRLYLTFVLEGRIKEE